jgi:hypothetical protein
MSICPGSKVARLRDRFDVTDVWIGLRGFFANTAIKI